MDFLHGIALAQNPVVVHHCTSYSGGKVCCALNQRHLSIGIDSHRYLEIQTAKYKEAFGGNSLRVKIKGKQRKCTDIILELIGKGETNK